jgi:hypothetical protein
MFLHICATQMLIMNHVAFEVPCCACRVDRSRVSFDSAWNVRGRQKFYGEECVVEENKLQMVVLCVLEWIADPDTKVV